MFDKELKFELVEKYGMFAVNQFEEELTDEYFLMCEYFFGFCNDKKIAEDSAMDYIEKQYPNIDKAIEEWIARDIMGLNQENPFDCPLNF